MIPRIHLTPLLALALLAGCDAMPRSYISDDGQVLPEMMGKPLVPAAAAPLADVPLPQGFVVVQPRSKTYVADNAKVTEQVYQGRATVADTAAFYRAQLRARNWQPQGEREDDPAPAPAPGSRVVMQWSKPGQTVIVSVQNVSDVATVRVRLQDRNLPPLPPGRPGPSVP